MTYTSELETKYIVQKKISTRLNRLLSVGKVPGLSQWTDVIVNIGPELEIYFNKDDFKNPFRDCQER